MQKIQDIIASLSNRTGIEKTWREKCEICNYGTRVHMIVNGEEKSHCRYCEDKKMLEDMHEKGKVSFTKEERETEKKQSMARAFDKPYIDINEKRINNYEPQNQQQERAKKESIEFIRSFEKGKSFIISGDVGTGKTHIASAMYNELQKKNACIFIKTTEILQTIRDTYSRNDISEQDVLNALIGVDILFLDDFGAEYSKDQNESWASDIIYKIADGRLNKSTVVTTNYTETALVRKFGTNGERILSRLKKDAIMLRINGEDMRK